jgi:hypothetical protein
MLIINLISASSQFIESKSHGNQKLWKSKAVEIKRLGPHIDALLICEKIAPDKPIALTRRWLYE